MGEKIQIVRCPLCGGYMDQQDMDFWKCPNCEAELWPPEKEDSPEELARAARAAYLEDMRIGFFGFGGKRSSGSRCKRYGKKKVPAQLFTARYFLA